MVEFDEKCPIITSELKSKIFKLLPQQFPCLILSATNEANDGFSCLLRLSIDNKNDALDWKTTFEEQSLTTYRVSGSFTENTQKIVFKKRFHCHHNTRPRLTIMKPHTRHTACTARLTITIKQKYMKRSKDQQLKKYPCEVDIYFVHNHLINNAEALRHRNPTQELEDIFSNYFSNNHSPSSALESYKVQLQSKHGNDYYKVIADGSKCPTRKWCFDLYYKIFKQQYGEPSGEQMIASLKKSVYVYNELHKEECAILKEDPVGLILAICSPLMKRVFSLKTAQEIMFVDSSGNMDRHNSRVFLMLAPSVAGALPLGILVTFSETEAVISQGLELFKKLNGVEKFSPKIIMTDDSTAERNSLKMSFPLSNLLLCKFHVLQSIWRYLWDGKHKVEKNDRQYLYRLFSKTLNSKTEENFVENFEDMISSDATKKYKHYIQYLLGYKVRASEWAMYSRNDLLTRNNNTNNYSESSIKILEEKILKRTKAFSIVQLFHFITKVFNDYYERKLIDIVNNRSEGITKLKYFIDERKIKDLVCSKINDGEYEVRSNDKIYYVDYVVGTCTCRLGNNGAPCKHQYAVVSKFNLTSEQFVPVKDSKTKEKLYFIATGKQLDDTTWCDNLTGPNKDSINIPVSSSSTENSISINNHIIDENTSPEEPDLKICIDLKETFSILENRFLNDRQTFETPIRQFINSFKNIKTDSGLIYAFHTFGKYSGAGMPLIKRGKNLQGSKIIGVQPTAIARRKVSLGGRKAQITGRPPKVSGIEHAYNKRRATLLDLPCPKKKAPHSIEHCVVENISLGKQH